VQFNRFRHLVALIPAVLLATVTPADSQATQTQKQASGMQLVLNYVGGNGWPSSDCYHEDSVHQRVWKGKLGPGESFTVPVVFCAWDDPIFGGPGGAVMRVTASGVALSIVSPQGYQYTPKVLDTRSGLIGGWITTQAFDPIQQFSKCSYREFDPLSSCVEGGAWTVKISNAGKKTATAQLEVAVDQIASQFYRDFDKVLAKPVGQPPYPTLQGIVASGVASIVASNFAPSANINLVVYHMDSLACCGPWGPAVSNYWSYPVTTDATGRFQANVITPLPGRYFVAVTDGTGWLGTLKIGTVLVAQ
jgi:hypothetical protein